MAEPSTFGTHLSLRAKVLGTLFLVFQLLFALNNYGPQNIPGLALLFDSPFVAPQDVRSWTGTSTVRFEDVTEAAGLAAYPRASFHDALPRYLEVMGGGVAVGDYDGDGWEDLLLTALPTFHPDSSSPAATLLLRNTGDGSFEDVTQAAGLADVAAYPQGAVFFDVDDDGDDDLYVAAYGGGRLLENQGGTFTDVTRAAGLDLEGRCGESPCFSSAAAVADYDRDGSLDLLVVNNVAWSVDDPTQHGPRHLFPAFFPAQASFLFRNRGDGTFEDVTAASGLDNAGGKGLGAVWTDIDDDGWPDAYVTNDLTPNTLYINRGDGTFEEIAERAGLDEIKSSMGVAAGDYDHNGHMDLVITNLKGSKLSLFRNDGGLRFGYATNTGGLAPSSRASGWGVELVDVDLDGYQDIVASSGPVWEREPTGTANLLFRNRDGERFEDVSSTAGALEGAAVSRGLAVADLDRDGWPDLVFADVDGAAPHVLRNQGNALNGWLQVRLEGTASNRNAVGARVEIVRSDSLRMTQEVRAGSSYQSASTRALFFGLDEARPARMTIRWPSGAVETFRELPSNRILNIQEGKGMQLTDMAVR